MIHSVFQIILGYLLWKYFPTWLKLRDTRTVDHYIIVGLAFVGIIMMLMGGFHLLSKLLSW